MNSNQHPTFFPLIIRPDTDGIEWTHFSNEGYVVTLAELPRALQAPARNITKCLLNKRLNTLDISRDTELLPEGFEPFVRDFRLIAWWLEWRYRKEIGRAQWTCPECQETVMLAIGHCPRADCLSWKILTHITGIPILKLVQKRKRISS